MGMTIEEAIKYYENKNVVLTEEEALANTLAMNAMRKYQKIQSIVSDFREYQKGISCGFGGATYMQMVSEVLEDGKID